MIGLMREMAQDWLGRTILLLIAFAMGLLVSLPFQAQRWTEEQKQWEAFAVEHQCRIVVSTPSTTTLTPITVGKSIMLVPQTHPGRTTYLCNDERTYTR